LVTSQQAAELFDVTTRTIRNWRRDGLLEPVTRPKGRVFYRLKDLLRLFEPR
jgi:DNA-binding transcriptional MerR regulator